NSMSSGQLSTPSIVAKWEIPLSDGVYTVEFEHGTASGTRAIFINGKCIRRQEFKFALIGEEHFKVGSEAHCTVQIKTVSSMDYGYFLLVNGLPFEQFLANQAKQLKCWILPVDEESLRVVLRLDSMEVYSNGEQLDIMGEFTDEGSETHFELRGTPCMIRVTNSATSAAGRRKLLKYTMYYGNNVVPEAAVDQMNIWDAHW
ncbi:hypothetical protein BOX15_Mlig019786g3, partial [Macrostomum lignano]